MSLNTELDYLNRHYVDLLDGGWPDINHAALWHLSYKKIQALATMMLVSHDVDAETALRCAVQFLISIQEKLP